MEALWTSEDVAAYLNVSIHTVRSWQTKRRIPFVRLNGAIRYVPADIRAWIERQTVAGRA